MKKNKIVRKYETDIWQSILQKRKVQRVGKYLKKVEESKRRLEGVLRVDIVRLKKKRKSQSLYGKKLLEYRKLNLFYGGIKSKEYRNLEKPIIELERRLSTVVMRMFFVRNIEESKKKIKEQKILVNREVITNPKYKVKAGDCIEIIDNEKINCYNELIERRKKKEIGVYIKQKNIEVNHKIMVGYYIRDVKEGEELIPIKRRYVL